MSGISSRRASSSGSADAGLRDTVVGGETEAEDAAAAQRGDLTMQEVHGAGR